MTIGASSEFMAAQSSSVTHSASLSAEGGFLGISAGVEAAFKHSNSQAMVSSRKAMESGSTY